MSLVSYVQVSEKLIRLRIIASLLKTARECQYCCIVIDEAESLRSHPTPKHSDGASGVICKLLADMFSILPNDRQRKRIVAMTSRPGDR